MHGIIDREKSAKNGVVENSSEKEKDDIPGLERDLVKKLF